MAKRHITTFSPSKLNLFLEVYDRLPNGYHYIESVFARIGLFDRMEFTIDQSQVGEPSIKVKTVGVEIPSGQNIVCKAAKTFLAKAGIGSYSIEAVIFKNVPVGAGLGGGSANAAKTLELLNEYFGRPFNQSQLMDLGLEVGSDVPFFLSNAKLAVIKGQGEVFERIDEAGPVRYFLVVFPERLSISTKEVYSRVKLDYAPRPLDNFLNPLKNKKDTFNFYFNRLEYITLMANHKALEVREEIERCLERKFFMTGSGSAFFAPIEPIHSEQTLKKLQKLKNIRSWLVELV